MNLSSDSDSVILPKFEKLTKSQFHWKYNYRITEIMLDGGLTVGNTGGQYTAVGFCGRYSRNVTATDAQPVALHTQHVPHSRTRTLGLIDKWWSQTKRWEICGGAGWVRLGATGLTLTVYLERSYSILRRKANKLSAPLEQEAAAREKQPGVRSIVTHPEWDTALQKTRKLFRKGEGKHHYVRTVSVTNIRPFIMKRSYVRLNKSAGIYKQTMGKVTELQSFFHKSA